MRKIFKYSLPVQEKYVIQLPQDAKIIRVEDVDGLFFLWAIVDPDAPMQDRFLEFYKTGQPIETDMYDLEFLGTCKLFIMQELCLYVFENVRKTSDATADKVIKKIVDEPKPFDIFYKMGQANPDKVMPSIDVDVPCTHPNKEMFTSDLDWCPDCHEKFDPYEGMEVK